MASGRLIHQKITEDKKVNSLSDDTSRLAFTWLITFADAEGRTVGDPALLRAKLFPRRDDVTIGRMMNYIQEWNDAGLIIWYVSGDEQYISFPNFDRYQPNLRKEREAPSRIPPPPEYTGASTPEEVLSNSGVSPEQISIKLSLNEVKLNQSKAKNEIDYRPFMMHLQAREPFKAAWAEWLVHQSESGRPLGDSAIRKQAAQINAWTPERAIAAIENSITNNYRGLIEPKPQKQNTFGERQPMTLPEGILKAK
jgi:hypothetical protein